MKRMPRLIVAASILLSIALSASADESKTKAKKPLFTADSYMAHVKYLASDELEGRLPGSQGSAAAAKYIIEHFQAAGLRPAGIDGGWYQPFEIRRGKRIVEDEAAFSVEGIGAKWKLREDWVPFPFSEMGEVTGPLAFAGYGIKAPKFGYDDYDGFDAKGKILLVFRYEPLSDDTSAEFGGETPSRHALFVRKARVASKAGAKALLIVNPPTRNPDEDKLYPFDIFNTQQTYQLPMAHISRKVADAILKQAGMPDLKTLAQKLDQERKPLSKDLGLTAKLNVGLKKNTLPGKNILALLPGDGSTDETIVVGAHRDHVGVVPRQFQRKDLTPMIHNGADDNASGSAAILELARVMAAGPQLHRNVLFIAFDGEEMGLLGSRYYVNHPTIPLETIPAMVNFDMIGRLKQNKYTVFGEHSGKEFAAIVKKYADRVGLKFKAPKSMAGGSDHSSFLQHRIPAMFPFTGVHKQYHQPEDDWQLIDGEGATKILGMWLPIITDLANMKHGPTFVDPNAEPAEEEEEEVVEAPKPALEEKALPATNGEAPNADAKQKEKKEEQPDADDSDAPPSRDELRVNLRIIPDMVGDDKPGMLVDSVIAGGPAAKAGIKDGDRIMKIGDEDIRDIYAYMRALKEYKPGDVADVVVVRKGKELTLKVHLQKAKSRKSGD